MSYTDGSVTIRSLGVGDLDAHLAATDDQQIDWLWEPGHRESWEAMTPSQQREHTRRFLRDAHDTFGPGPKWCFAVETPTVAYVAYVDCDLANPHVPAGQANISYAAHPDYRGRGHVSAAVRLVARFLREETTATEAHLVVDAANAPSLRVASSVGALPTERWTNEEGRSMIRHVLVLRPSDA